MDAPASLPNARKLVSSWQKDLTPTWIADATAIAAPDSLAAIAAAQAQAPALQARDAKAAAFNDLTAKSDALKAELSGLPARIKTAQDAISPAEVAIQKPKADLDAANARVNSLSYSYGQAMNGRYSVIACQILVTFGSSSGPCGSTAGYDAVIAQYNGALAQANAAFAYYKSYYDAYKAKYDAYKALIDRQAAANSEANSVAALVASAKSELDAAEAALTAAGAGVQSLGTLQQALAQYSVSEAAARAATTQPLRGSESMWRSAFDRAAFIVGKHRVYLGRALAAYQAFSRPA